MISIKGVGDGLIVVCDDTPWHSQLGELQRKLDANARFFRGGRIALDVKELDLSPEDILHAQTLLQRYDVRLWAVLSQNLATSTRAEMLSLANTLEPVEPIESSPGADGARGTTAESGKTGTGAGSPESTDGILVRKRVRSGQVLRNPGHIVVVGDVNPGAQIIAGGDIVIWGKLQGLVHAGALGDAKAVICALDFKPSLIRIADAARGMHHTPQRGHIRRPEMALLDQQEIKLVPWQDR